MLHFLLIMQIILIQENEIQQLNENLRSLRLQLEQCQKAGFLNETLSVIPDGNEKQDIPADWCIRTWISNVYVYSHFLSKLPAEWKSQPQPPHSCNCKSAALGNNLKSAEAEISFDRFYCINFQKLYKIWRWCF